MINALDWKMQFLFLALILLIPFIQSAGAANSSTLVHSDATMAAPTVVRCSYIMNFSQKNSETLNLMGSSFLITENYITPTSAGISVNDAHYEITIGHTTYLGKFKGVNYTLNLLNLSYIPRIDIVTVSLCGTGPGILDTQQTTTMPTVTTSASSTVPSTAPSTTLVQTSTAPSSTTSTTSGTVSSTNQDIAYAGGAAVAIIIVAAVVFLILKEHHHGARRRKQ